VDAALDTKVTDASMLNCLNALRICGKYCLTGEGTQGASLDLLTLITRELTIVGSWGARIGSLLDLAAAVAERAIPLSTLVTHRFQLSGAASAFELYESQSTGKVLLTWPVVSLGSDYA
jgi:threonine dehydrogenase-like Zn-dependent dehydrogenase